jgi:hypothetical protein
VRQIISTHTAFFPAKVFLSADPAGFASTFPVFARPFLKNFAGQATNLGKSLVNISRLNRCGNPLFAGKIDVLGEGPRIVKFLLS